jgi:hypothetical protein
MVKAKILYQSSEEVYGKHIRSGEWVCYSGTLLIFERKTYPIVLKLRSEIGDSFLQMMMDEDKEIKGVSVSEVYGKVSRWLYDLGVIHRN